MGPQKNDPTGDLCAYGVYEQHVQRKYGCVYSKGKDADEFVIARAIASHMELT